MRCSFGLVLVILLIKGCSSATTCLVTSTGTVEMCKYECCTIAGKSSCCNMDVFIIGGVSGGFICMIIGILFVYFVCGRPEQQAVRRIAVVESGAGALDPRQRTTWTNFNRPRGPPPVYSENL